MCYRIFCKFEPVEIETKCIFKHLGCLIGVKITPNCSSKSPQHCAIRSSQSSNGADGEYTGCLPHCSHFLLLSLSLAENSKTSTSALVRSTRSRRSARQSRRQHRTSSSVDQAPPRWLTQRQRKRRKHVRPRKREALTLKTKTERTIRTRRTTKVDFDDITQTHVFSLYSPPPHLSLSLSLSLTNILSHLCTVSVTLLLYRCGYQAEHVNITLETDSQNKDKALAQNQPR